MTRALGWVVWVVASSAVAAAPEVASLKVYQGHDGQVVEVATLEPVKARAALLRLRGANSGFDGLVLRGTLEARGAFVTRIHGGEWTVLRLTDGRGTVYAEGTSPFEVAFHETGTPALAEALRSAHQQQTASGELAMLAKKEFPFLVKKYEAQAAAAVAGLNQACGTRATFAFRWVTFSDEDMADLDAWALCAPVLTAARGHCAAVKDITSFACGRGAKFDLRREAGTVTFTTTEKGKADGPAFVSSALERP